LKREEEVEAVEIFAKRFPNSFIADLLLYFDKETILQIIELYSGRVVKIPTIKSVWVNYRNQKIKSILDKKNSRKNRELLAETFGLSVEHVSWIYSRVAGQKVPRIKYRTIEHLVGTIFRKNLRNFYRELRKISGNTGKVGVLHDIYQNPEYLFAMKEKREELIKDCVNDINAHLILSDRENHRDKAISILLSIINGEL